MSQCTPKLFIFNPNSSYFKTDKMEFWGFLHHLFCFKYVLALLGYHIWIFPDSHCMVFTFRSWLNVLGVVLAFWISILKSFKLLQNRWHRAVDITSFEKHLKSSLDHTPNFCPNLVIFEYVKRNLSSALLRWCSLQTKEGQTHTEFHFVKHSANKAMGTIYARPCPNLLRGDKVLIFVPSDC